MKIVIKTKRRKKIIIIKFEQSSFLGFAQHQQNLIIKSLRNRFGLHVRNTRFNVYSCNDNTLLSTIQHFFVPLVSRNAQHIIPRRMKVIIFSLFFVSDNDFLLFLTWIRPECAALNLIRFIHTRHLAVFLPPTDFIELYAQKTIIYHNFLFPFINRELLSHENVVFNDNGTVSTQPKHPLLWDAERSVGRSENDTLILPNIALLVSLWLRQK